MRIKVIIDNGIVTDVLADESADLEVVDINDDYSDFDELRAYRDDLYKDESLRSIDFTVANFQEEKN